MSLDPLTHTTLLIRSAAFGANPDTAASNAFQQAPAPGESGRAVADAARGEFDGLVRALRDAGVEAIIVDDTPEPATPDAVFPNNWFSTHADGRVVLYPLLSPMRRLERRTDVIEALRDGHGFAVASIDSSLVEMHEAEGRFLEGTGSVVLDRAHGVAYACRSARTHAAPFRDLCAMLGCEGVLFDGSDSGGTPPYHTNVILTIGEDFAIIASGMIAEHDRERVLGRLRETGRSIVEISEAQVHAFAGNGLALRSRDGAPLLAVSDAAYAAFTPDQRNMLESCAHIVHAPIPTVERLGGGSVRCMLAEVFLRRSD